jgi:hypothetical protein
MESRMSYQDEDTTAIAQSATLWQQPSSRLQRRNRLLAVALAGVAIGVLVVALVMTLTIHDIEAGRVFANF